MEFLRSPLRIGDESNIKRSGPSKGDFVPLVSNGISGFSQPQDLSGFFLEKSRYRTPKTILFFFPPLNLVFLWKDLFYTQTRLIYGFLHFAPKSISYPPNIFRSAAVGRE